jgi:hypothetical protein
MRNTAVSEDVKTELAVQKSPEIFLTHWEVMKGG